MSTVESTGDGGGGVVLPRVYGIYEAEDVAGGYPLHVDDAFGWVLATRERAYLVRWDAEAGRSMMGSFGSVGAIVRTFGRVEPISVLRPRRQPVWPDRLTADDDAFAIDLGELTRQATPSTGNS